MSDESSKQAVMVELKVAESTDAETFDFAGLDLPGFEPDEDYTPVPMKPPAGERGLEASGETLLLIRGNVDADKLADLKADSRVYNVWTDTPIEPFSM